MSPRRASSSTELISQYARVLAAVGAAIALRRKARRLTQEELAEQVGIDRSFVSSLERGRRNPTLITLYRLSASLDWNLVDLFRAADLGRAPKRKPDGADP